MVRLKPYSASLLALSGVLLGAMGVYFIFLRPLLLPEDLRYMKTTLPAIHDSVPGLFAWLQKVFWVMGAFIFTTGLLTFYISVTSFRKRLPGAFRIVVLAGITSVGLMTVINFMIGSDFKWLLLTFTLPWATALILYRLHK